MSSFKNRNHCDEYVSSGSSPTGDHISKFAADISPTDVSSRVIPPLDAFQTSGTSPTADFRIGLALAILENLLAPILRTFEKEIPCTCSSVHCIRYHGLPKAHPAPQPADFRLSKANISRPFVGRKEWESAYTAQYSDNREPVRKATKRTGSFVRAPNWTGEPKPGGYVRADKVQRRNGTIISQFPSTAELFRLVSRYGYDGHAALAALPRAHRPWEFASDREQGDTKTGGQQSLLPAQPYAPESPGKRTTEYKLGYSKESVMEKLRPKRWSDDHKSAVFEILSLGRDAFLVAASLRLDCGTVRRHCAQIRREIERKRP